MLARIQNDVQRRCQLTAEALILVGVSGGPDSLCLLDVLWRLKYPLLVAHFDHGLRPTSGAEAEAVREISLALGVPCHLGRGDVKGYAKARKLSIEEAAREARYQFLFEQARLHGAQAVAVGHTADDQVETVLMHLLRGAGLSGLKGMPYRSLPNAWSTEIPLVRPLLGIWREEVLRYLEENQLKPILDESNLDLRYHRNRLRHEVIPFLEKINPHLRQNIWRTADVLQADEAVLNSIGYKTWEECLRELGSDLIIFDLGDFCAQPLGVQRYLLRKAINQLQPGLRDIGYESIERALAFVEAPPRSRRVDLVAGICMFVEGNTLGLTKRGASLSTHDWPQIAPGVELILDAPGEVPLLGGWKLTAEIVEADAYQEQALRNTDPFRAWLDRDTLDIPLKVRAARRGERFEPLGMGGKSLKLSDFWINVKLPRRARAGWPLVFSDERIVWVPGYRLAHPFRVRNESTALIYLHLQRY